MAELRHLEEQATGKRVSPAQVRSFFRVLHTLKGTAALVDEAKDVVSALHAIEGKLACQNVSVSARQPDWVPEAGVALRAAQAALCEMQRKEKYPPQAEALVRGFLVRSTLPGRDRLLWFPVTCVTRIVSPGEMLGQTGIQIEGAWVPVLGDTHAQSGRSVFGLAVRSEKGRLVVAIEEVLSVDSWTVALEQGAESGLDLFDRDAEADSAADAQVA